MPTLPAPPILTTLQHRPLLWIAPAVAAGCAAGGHIALSWGEKLGRDAPILLAPLALTILAVVLAWRLRPTHTPAVIAALSVAIAGFCASHAARRMLPPRNDISTLVTAAPQRNGPLQRLPVVLEGQVAAPPQRGDFGIEFLLKCSAPRSGYVWVEAPLNAPVADGATLRVSALLSMLPRPGNIAERSRHLRYIVAGCWCVARVQNISDIQHQQHAASSWLTQRLAAVRARLPAYYAAEFSRRGQPYPEATARLLSAMVFGEGALTEPLPRLTRDEFRVAGLSHLLVASGTQISLFGLLLLGAARLFGLRRWWMLLAVLPALLFYALLTGGQASIWRATIGGTCLTFAILLGRDADNLSLWSLALAALLIVDPAQLYSLSFQLTFAATWGLIVLAPHLARVLRSRFDDAPVSQLMALSLGAQLATVPLLLYHFGRLSTVGLAANFIGVPLAGVLVSTGVLGLVVPPVNVLNYWLARSIATLATFTAHAPAAQVEASLPGSGWTLLWYAGVLCAVSMAATIAMGKMNSDTVRDIIEHWWQQQRRRAVRPQAIVPLLLVLLTAFVGWRTFLAAPRQLRVTVLDVGQGESILIESPSGRTVLIDGGTLSTAERGDVGRSIIVPYLQSRGVQRLDAVVVTHADADHLNALPQVVREVPVGLVLDGGASTRGINHDMAGEVEYQTLIALVRQRGIIIKEPRAGQQLNLGGGAVLTVLSPLEPPLQSGNNNSIVLRLDYGTTSMLLTADIEREAEERLVRRGANLRCTILKVAHHGSKTSTSALLMRAAQPEAAIISCGRYNPFGHPAAQTLQRLTAEKVPVFRTDVNGAVEIQSDGRRCWVQTFR